MNDYCLALLATAALSLSAEVSEGQTVTGIETDFERLSETVAFVPDVPNHVMVQGTWMWKLKTSDPKIGDGWVTNVEQVESIGDDVKERGHTIAHFTNGDVLFSKFEGTGKVLPQDKGPPHVILKGSFTWTGGTGTHNLTGHGIYNCEMTSPPAVQGIDIPGQCNWQGEPKFASQ